jgi:hypothetical protein
VYACRRVTCLSLRATEIVQGPHRYKEPVIISLHCSPPTHLPSARAHPWCSGLGSSRTTTAARSWGAGSTPPSPTPHSRVGRAALPRLMRRAARLAASGRARNLQPQQAAAAGPALSGQGRHGCGWPPRPPSVALTSCVPAACLRPSRDAGQAAGGAGRGGQAVHHGTRGASGAVPLEAGRRPDAGGRDPGCGPTHPPWGLFSS